MKAFPLVVIACKSAPAGHPTRLVKQRSNGPIGVETSVPIHKHTFSRSLAAPICLAQALTVALAARF